MVGFDPQTFPAQSGEVRTKYFADNGMVFKPVDKNLAIEIWTDRPAYPPDQIRQHIDEFAGVPA